MGIELVTRFHSEQEAIQAKEAFINRFAKNEIPEDLTEIICQSALLANVLKEAKLVASTSEAYRLIESGAVKINGEKVSDKKLLLSAGFNAVVQVGKIKMARIIVK